MITYCIHTKNIGFFSFTGIMIAYMFSVVFAICQEQNKHGNIARVKSTCCVSGKLTSYVEPQPRGIVASFWMTVEKPIENKKLNRLTNGMRRKRKEKKEHDRSTIKDYAI
jgi:hypothetical protein